MDFDKLIAQINAGKLTDVELTQIIIKCSQVKCVAKLQRSIIQAPISIRLWIETKPKIKGEVVNEVYNNYTNWCEKYNCAISSKTLLSKFISNEFGIISKVTNVGGKSTRKYL